MKAYSRIISLFMAVTMSLSFVACKSDATSGTPSTESTKEETTTSQSTIEPTESSELEEWYTMCDSETFLCDEDQAVQVYSYPKDNLLGLERIEFFEDRIITVFDQEINDASEWPIMGDSVKHWEVRLKPNEEEVEWDTLLACEDGKYIVASVVTDPNMDLDLLDYYMEIFYDEYPSGINSASISLEEDATVLDTRADRNWSDCMGEKFLQVFDHVIGRWESPQSTADSAWPPSSVGYGRINISIFATIPSYEVWCMMCDFMEQNPELEEKYSISYFTKSLTFQDREMRDIKKGKYSSDGAEMYIICADEISEYTQEEWSQYFATYEDILGNDVMTKIQEAEIPDYVVDLGSNNEGKVIALNYENTTGAFIYRRSIAKEVFGSDNPAIVEEAIGAGTGSWEKFLQTAEIMKEKGYAMVPGLGDLYLVADKTVQVPWEVDGKFNLDAQREAYIDLAEKMIANDYTNDHEYMYEEWWHDVQDEGERKVFGWFGTQSMVNGVINNDYGNPSYFGDYAVCRPNMSFWQSGSWLFASRHILDDPDKKEFCAKFIEWVTLNTSDKSFQYGMASGTIYEDKWAVASGKVMSVADGSMRCLDGQNPYQVYIDAATSMSTTGICTYDKYFNEVFVEQVNKYAHGEISKEELMEELYQLAEKLGIEV